MTSVRARSIGLGGFLFLMFSFHSTAGQARQRPAPLVSREEQAESELKAGLQAYRAGQLDRAIVRLKRAHAVSPDDPQVRLYLGLFLYEQDRDSLEAQRYLESVAEQFPSHSDMQLRLLDSYLRARSAAKGEALVRRLSDRMAADSRFAFNVIYTLIRHGQLDIARKEIEAASGILQGEVMFIGGLISLGSGENEKALGLFQGASQRGFPPRESRQMLTLAEAYFKLRAFVPAARAYEAFLENHADANSTNRLQLGLSYYAYGDFERALEQLRRVRKDAPDTPEIDFHLGSILIELKNTGEARPFLEAEVKRLPASYKAATKLAYLEYLDGKDDTCRQWLEKSLALDASWFETHMVYGLLHNRLGEYEKAVSSLEICIREEPEYPKAYFQLSSAYRRLGNEEKADQYLERFKQLQNAAISNTQKALGLHDRLPKF